MNSIPSLWTSIDFMRQGESQNELRYIHLCLERSRNAPLHMRIGKMNFECPLPSMSVEISTLVHAIAPRLRSLAIAYWRFGLTKEILGTLDALGASNTLQELALYATSGDKLIFADSDFLPQARFSSPNTREKQAPLDGHHLFFRYPSSRDRKGILGKLKR